MKKMSKGMLMTALICGAVYLVGSPVYANELQEFALDEYVVTAARTETKLVDTPANISVVDAQTIEERHYQDVSEVLKDVPGANVIDSGVGAYEKTIRINGDDRVLVLVDGRKVNFDMGNMNGRSSFDMNQLPDIGLIERIEILKGAGGALYGSDAVGGVVNIITKKADRSFGKVSVAMGSMGAKDYSAMYSIKEGKTGVSVAASKSEQDYYKYRDAKSDTTKRWHGESNFKDEKISLKLDQELGKETNLEIGYDYSKFEGWNPYQATYYSPSYIEKETKNVHAKIDWLLHSNDVGYVQLYQNQLEYSNQGTMEEDTNGVDLQQQVTINDKNKIVFGVSYRESDVDSNYIPYGQNIQINNYKNNVDNISLFINDNWEFAPSWTLNAGVRYDDHSEAGDDTTLSFGINKKFDNNSHLYFNWSEVFKAPTLDDLYYNSYTEYLGTKYYMYGNTNLKPETGDTWTIGYSTAVDNKTNIGINYFESNLENAISWEYINSNDQQAKNIAEQEKRGLELTFNHKLNDHMELEASYTYIRVKNNDGYGYYRDTNQIPNIYRLGLRYKDGKVNTDLFLRYGTGAFTDYDSNKFTNPYLENSYLTLDMAITYNVTNDLSLYAKGYNLLNEAYAETAGSDYGSYRYPAQSRRFIVGAEYKF